MAKKKVKKKVRKKTTRKKASKKKVAKKVVRRKGLSEKQLAARRGLGVVRAARSRGTKAIRVGGGPSPEAAAFGITPGAEAELKSAPGLKGMFRRGYSKLPKALKGGAGIMNLLLAGLIAKELSGAYSRGKKADKELTLLKATPELTTEDYLRMMRERELLASREGRLARNDPEAYAALQNMLSGQGSLTPLATGEFRVGGPPANPVSSEDLQRVLAALP